MRYTIENLVTKFKEHSIKAAESQEHFKKVWQENNPEERLPEHMRDDFNLPKALHVMCKEVAALKKLLKGK